MATQTKSSPVTETIDAATERVVELNEKAVANGKKTSAAILDTYEKAVISLTDSYEKAAGTTKVDWIVSAASAQADFTREVAKAYTSAAREFVVLSPSRRVTVAAQDAPRPSAGRPPALHERAVDLQQRLPLASRQHRVCADRRDDGGLVGCLTTATAAFGQNVGRKVEVLRNRIEHLLRRLTQASLDLGQVRIRDADEIGQLAH